MEHPSVDGTSSLTKIRVCFDITRQVTLLLSPRTQTVGYVLSKVKQDLNWSSGLLEILIHKSGKAKSADCLACSRLRQVLIRSANGWVPLPSLVIGNSPSRTVALSGYTMSVVTSHRRERAVWQRMDTNDHGALFSYRRFWQNMQLRHPAPSRARTDDVAPPPALHAPRARASKRVSSTTRETSSPLGLQSAVRGPSTVESTRGREQSRAPMAVAGRTTGRHAHRAAGSAKRSQTATFHPTATALPRPRPPRAAALCPRAAVRTRISWRVRRCVLRCSAPACRCRRCRHSTATRRGRTSCGNSGVTTCWLSERPPPSCATPHSRRQQQRARRAHPKCR